MKNLKFIIPTLLLTLILGSCSDDDNTPEVINETEVITTVIVNLVSTDNTVTLTSRDLDGDGPDLPVEEVSGNLIANTTYTGTIQFLNELESPAEDITLEVQEEDDDHQVFIIPSGTLQITSTASNFDDNGNPLGTQFSLQSNAAGQGNLNFTLRHLPNKPNDGTLADAGGETDASVNFEVIVE